MLSFRLRSGGEEGIFCADVMHNPIQVVRRTGRSLCAMGDQALESRAAGAGACSRTRRADHAMHFGAPYCGYIRRRATAIHSNRRNKMARCQRAPSVKERSHAAGRILP